MFNFAGNSKAINAANKMSLHATNPGTGANPAAGSELTDAPYARQNCVFDAPVAVGTAAVSELNADVVFNLHLTINQNAQYIGLWENATYLGYIVPDEPFNFTGNATERSFTVEAATTKLIRDNP